MRWGKAVALALVLAAGPVAATAQGGAAARIAVVDTQRVLLGVNDGKAAKARLQAWLDRTQKSIDSEQVALRDEKVAIDSAKGLSEAARAQRMEELRKKVTALAERWERSRTEAANLEQKEMAPILKKIDVTLAKLAQQEGMTLVIEKQGDHILYGTPPGTDLTDKLIRAYDAAPK